MATPEFLRMEWPTFVRDFFKFLTCDDCASNELFIPQKFVDMHGHHLTGSLILSLRNGYKIEVVYDRVNRKLLGVGPLFSDFALVGGEILLFESVDFHTFNLYIIGEDGCEIQYPSVVHSSQYTTPVPVTIRDGGWKFIKLISFAYPIGDEVAPPRSFMRMFGSDIPEWFTYNLKNHMICGGHYEFLRSKLSGMRSVIEGLRLADLSLLEMLVFTYDGGRVFKLSLFDGSCVEIGLDVNVVASGSLPLTFQKPVHFKIKIMASHMLHYCHGVTIPAEFQSVTALWKKKDNIVLYKGCLSWPVEIRKRSQGNRTSIHGGWIHFRQAMQVNVGDCLYFKMIDGCYRRFRVEIVKSTVLNS